jgi:hypothetical protein
MRAHPIVLTLALELAACSQADGNGSNLQAAAKQSDPVSAAILEDSAANGSDPEAALAVAGRASAATDKAIKDGVTLQARPNLLRSPNRKNGTEPPDKVWTPVR